MGWGRINGAKTTGIRNKSIQNISTDPIQSDMRQLCLLECDEEIKVAFTKINRWFPDDLNGQRALVV